MGDGHAAAGWTSNLMRIIPRHPSNALIGIKTFANVLAVYVDWGIVVAVADVLQQMRHLGKRAPLAVFGQVFLPFSGLRLALSILCVVHTRKQRDAKTGYKLQSESDGSAVSA